MDPTAERRVDAHPPIAHFVAKPLHHDRAVVRYRSSRGRLVVEIGQQVLDRPVVEPGALTQASGGGLGSRGAQFADHLAQRGAELDRPAGRVRFPERDLAWLARRRGDQHLGRRDLRDAPGRRAQDEVLPHARLVDHLLVQLTDAPAVAGQVHGVEAAIRDGARVRHGQALGPGAPAQLSRNAIPDDARPELDELVRRVTATEHVEHRFERARPRSLYG